MRGAYNMFEDGGDPKMVNCIFWQDWYSNYWEAPKYKTIDQLASLLMGKGLILNITKTLKSWLMVQLQLLWMKLDGGNEVAKEKM
ncbi:unnamed protein product [Trifolium pratense]|uniref:Uncharacterized protein n=1 Tax=Trifolium pratense TaxID=57577 RepID=A0ACB0KP16_TRIPR|nr:unnamed protein product [Trifolium pratense]